jgi:hypothetical protein
MKLSSTGNGQRRWPAAVMDWYGMLWKRALSRVVSAKRRTARKVTVPQTLTLLPDPHDLYLAERIP